MRKNLVPNPQTATSQQIIRFGGVNYSQGAGEGELTESLNMSAREFPCLSQRRGRWELGAYAGTEAMFEYFGKLVLCKGGVLTIDGKEITHVEPGQKQFAMVNTQLVVWPDMITVDLLTESVVRVEEVVTVPHKDTKITYGDDETDDSITTPLFLNAEYLYINRSDVGAGTSTASDPVMVFTYGKDVLALQKHWDSEKNCWQGLESLEEVKVLFSTKKPYQNVAVGDILIPGTTNLIKTSYYAPEVGISGENPASGKVSTDGIFYIVYEASYSNVSFFAVDVKAMNVPLLYAASVGETVDISCGPFDIVGAEGAVIKRVETESWPMEGSPNTVLQDYNKICFTAGTLRRVVCCAADPLEREIEPWESCIITLKGETDEEGEQESYKFSLIPGNRVPKGSVLFTKVVTLNADVYAWNPERKMVYGPFKTGESSGAAIAAEITLDLLDLSDAPIKVRRSVPKMDYICGHQNRLWGVNNEKKTVYGSALGMPLTFQLYEGVGTDAFAVPVATDGDFTGICSYGDSLLLWKEDRLHKIMGANPDDYVMYEYSMLGVAEGSHKSMAIANETLYFHSREGVCTYTGGYSSLISSCFGLRRYRNAVGGTDGEHYYVSMESAEEEDEWGVWVFDPVTGIWMQETKERVFDFAGAGQAFYRLSADGLWAEQEENLESGSAWSATFAPMTELVHERKCYSSLLLRYELGKGSTLKVEISTDGGAFRELAVKKYNAAAGTAVLPIRPNRCDKFQIRLSGRGYCRIESLVRKMRAGGLW